MTHKYSIKSRSLESEKGSDGYLFSCKLQSDDHMHCNLQRHELDFCSTPLHNNTNTNYIGVGLKSSPTFFFLKKYYSIFLVFFIHKTKINIQGIFL